MAFGIQYFLLLGLFPLSCSILQQLLYAFKWDFSYGRGYNEQKLQLAFQLQKQYFLIFFLLLLLLPKHLRGIAT